MREIFVAGQSSAVTLGMSGMSAILNHRPVHNGRLSERPSFSRKRCRGALSRVIPRFKVTEFVPAFGRNGSARGVPISGMQSLMYRRFMTTPKGAKHRPPNPRRASDVSPGACEVTLMAGLVSDSGG